MATSSGSNDEDTTTAVVEGWGSGIAGVAPGGVGLAGVPEKGAPAAVGADAEAPTAAAEQVCFRLIE